MIRRSARRAPYPEGTVLLTRPADGWGLYRVDVIDLRRRECTLTLLTCDPTHRPTGRLPWSQRPRFSFDTLQVLFTAAVFVLLVEC